MQTGMEHRIAKAKIRIMDRGGQAVPAGMPVRFELQNHEFLFGCGAFDAVPACMEKAPEGAPPAAFFRDRMNKWLRVFNYGTLPFYWGRFEPEEGKPHTEELMRAAGYLQERGVTVKGHPLCWHTACANWLLKYDDKTIMDKQLERIHRDVSAFRGVINVWDVINETVIMPEFDRYDNAITRICRAYGRVNLIREVFLAAKAANPEGLFLINDFNLSGQYRDVIAECLDAGVPIGAIGLQSHQHQGYRGEAYFRTVLDRFAPLGLPLHFTENTLVSGHLMPPEIVDLNDYQIPEWPTTPEGEKRQAEEWEEMLRLLFGHPSVEAVTGWDFADGAWLGAPSGMIRKDGSEKPAYWKMKELIHQIWHTDETLLTDADGYVTLKGFRGTYRVSCAGGTGFFRLREGGGTPECMIGR